MVEVLKVIGIVTVAVAAFAVFSSGGVAAVGIGDATFGIVDGDGRVGIADPIPEPIPQGSIGVRLVPVATGLTAPNGGTFASGDTGRLFVTDQDGTLWGINLATGEKTVFLDVSDRLVELGAFGPNSYDERGLLGIAFHPSYDANGLLYTYTSEPVSGPADFTTMPNGTPANHQSVITEWQVPDPANPASVVDPTSARVLLRIDEPQFNHDAGAVNFGLDGMLYVSLGDGGEADDQGVGHGVGGNGQDPSNVLGTILRIDPLESDSANGQYGVPVDNPFVGQTGFVEEIFAYGFRNPFRFSFDTATGQMLIADVGQNDIEEIDVGVAGSNYGWNLKEGTFFFDANGEEPGFVTDVDPGVPPGLVDPIAQYDHDEGIAVIGGFVYRGSRIPALRGRYVFGDFARTFTNDGRLFYISTDNMQRTNQVVELQFVGQQELGMSLLGFGQDVAGELYVLANGTGTPFGDTGVVLKIAPAFLGLFLMSPGDVVADSSVLSATFPEDRGVFLVANVGDNGTLEAAVTDCRAPGNVMLLAVIVKVPGEPLGAPIIKACTSPGSCTVNADFPAGSVALGITGYLAAPGGFPAGYDFEISLQPEAVTESEIVNFTLVDLTISQGTTVTWVNRDSVPHTSTSGTPPNPSGEWDSPLLLRGNTFSHTFDEAGEFVYYCRVHPTIMRVTVTVVP